MEDVFSLFVVKKPDFPFALTALNTTWTIAERVANDVYVDGSSFILSSFSTVAFTPSPSFYTELARREGILGEGSWKARAQGSGRDLLDHSRGHKLP